MTMTMRTPAPAPSNFHFHFSTVTGIFLQDDPTTDPATFDYATTNFGLIPRAYDTDAEFDPDGKKPQWERLAHYIDILNRDSPPDVCYKLLFLGRHGQGVHNVAEERYGTELWDCYWSLLDGDAHGTWVDARLTETGIAQAQTAHDAWKAELEAGIPPPQSYYVSPLNRCLATASITFSGLGLPGTEPFRPVVKELLRETLGLHTCDKRSPKSTIRAEYPFYEFEPSFSEDDVLFDATLRESDSARDARLRDLLFDIFARDEKDRHVLSLTAHSGAITSILKVVGHRAFALATGAVIPVLVRGERRVGDAPVMVIEPGSPAPVCRDGSGGLGVGQVCLN